MSNTHESIETINQKLENQRYEIIAHIGSGAMAEVYLGRERNGKEQFAFKILREKFRHTPAYRDIFRKEAETMKSFQDPNIVRFYQYVEETTYVYIRMDYVKGTTLHKIVNDAKKSKTPLSVENVLRIVWQVAKGLDYLHHEKQLHLDVKPANVLLRDSDGKVFVTDLGLTMDENEVRTYKGGTPYYMPIEQQDGQIGLTTKADSYALAIMTYELLALVRPFETSLSNQEGRNALKEAHRTQVVPPITSYRNDLPNELNAIFVKALAKNSNNRFEVLEFVQALQTALMQHLPTGIDIRDLRDAKPLVAPKPQPIQQKPQSQSTHDQLQPKTQNNSSRQRLMSLLLVLVVIAGGIGIFLVMGQSETETTTPTVNAIAQVVEDAEETTEPEPTSNVSATQTDEIPEETAEPVINTPDIVETEISTQTPITPTVVQSIDEDVESTEVDSELPTMTSTNTPTNTPTPTATTTPTLTPPPTITNTPTTTPTWTPQPTAYLSNEQILLIGEGIETIGIGQNFNEALAFFAVEQQTIIPLRSGAINGFYFIVEWDNPSAFSSYGMVYRYVSEADYGLFRIQTATNTWEIIDVVNGSESQVDSGTLDTLPTRLAVGGRDAFVRLEYANTFTQYLNNLSSTGSLGVWVENMQEGGSIRTIQMALLGDEAVQAAQNIPTLVPPQITGSNFLLSDLEALLTTLNIDGIVACSEFVTIYEGLERHLSRDDVGVYAQDAQAQSTFIYNRCQTVGNSQTIDMNDVYTDVLTWENAIRNIINILSVNA